MINIKIYLSEIAKMRNKNDFFGFSQKWFFLFDKCWQMLHEWDRVDEQILEWTLTRVRLRLRDFHWNRDINMCVCIPIQNDNKREMIENSSNQTDMYSFNIASDKKSVSLNYIKLMLYHFCLNRRLCTRVRTKIPKCAGCYWRMR